MKGILREMYDHDPEKIIHKAAGKERTLTFNEIAASNNLADLKIIMIDKIFRSLENERSTKKLVKKIINHTGITIDSTILTNGLMHLEMRHLFIHNDGIADLDFVNIYGNLLVSPISQGDKLPRNFSQTTRGLIAVEKLAKEIDSKLITAGHLQSR
ncbi:hypothetical protein [Aureispira anguillae]|uniref:Uncharacterized protein n=1 Tax=Aureispira anguillae TaxID=2864201 RepID=A0A915YE68_9BACT|nr:hypothetical protein [Aureispira anguillae]BDS11477.1 hypothetical protein AsAng_0021910 [Aureispira anguillae]